MSKIGDLFVRLGLKKDDFSKGLNDAQREVSGFGNVLKKMASGAKVAWAAVGAAVVKFATDAVKMTQKWGDEWNITMAGIQGAYSAFVRQLASGEGFDHLFANMREAARVARETAAALDEVFERKISASYTTAKLDNEIADLQKQMNDLSKTSDERLDAADLIRQKTEERFRLLKDIQQQEADGYRNQLKAQATLKGGVKLNDDQINFLVKEYEQNRQILNQAREYNKEREKAIALAGGVNTLGKGTAGGGWNKSAAAAAAADIDKKYPEAVKKAGELIKAYDKTNDELVAKMANAETAVIELDTQMKHATDRADRLTGRLQKMNSGASSGSTSDPGAETAARILKRAEDSAKNEIQLYYEKYQEEKALLEQYNLDTTALTQEYFRNINGIIEKGLDEIKAPLVDFEPVELELIDVDESVLEEFVDKIDAEVKRAQDVAKEFGNAVAGGFADACQELMDQLMGLREFNPGSVVKALLEPLADMAVKAGTIIVAEGIATKAANSALKTFGETGWGAVAAGAALIAAGTAAKAGLAALASGGSATTSASTYSGASGGVNTQNVETEMTIYVEGRISGSDIVISGQKTVNAWNR